MTQDEFDKTAALTKKIGAGIAKLMFYLRNNPNYDQVLHSNNK